MPFLYLFLFWGIAELVVMIMVASAIGAMATFALLLLGMIAGSYLLKRTRLQFMQRMQEGQKSMNAPEMRDGLFQMMGATLLFIPGFISDALAVVCLLPTLRKIFGGVMMKIFRPEVLAGRFNWQQGSGGHVYEGEVRREAQSQAQYGDRVIEGTVTTDHTKRKDS
ncbi:FxsA family protein [Suttonella sp. R2A3]|uniref:FxsA family protein n=1 Tax=Suttonella sp. R2A3 TaxID=2908648 RepID=UPI001F3CEC8C|nr:FxsA family protein [Suttonella sp. R2A3]UJF24439.1 FxsA family protein [Suttonella sp. R2A3]